MIRGGDGLRVWVATAPVDMRKSFDGLAEVVRAFLGQDPQSGHMFVFRNRSGQRVKVLWWDKNGLAIYYKRLEKGTFAFPAGRQGGRRLRPRPGEALGRLRPPILSINPGCSALARHCARCAGVVHPRPP
jgi:transposase